MKFKVIFAFVLVLVLLFPVFSSAATCEGPATCAFKDDGSDNPGVINKVSTTENKVAITLDACSSGSDYDKELILE